LLVEEGKKGQEKESVRDEARETAGFVEEVG